jgi:hypothetical protein
MNARFVIGPLIALTAVLAVGCESRVYEKRKGEIIRLGLAYHFFHANHGASPSNLKDLEPAKREFPDIAREIEDGQFVVIWNAKLNRDGNENDKFVLAYPKEAEEKGGQVLLGGGSFQELTAEAFRGMPKAETLKGK